jgi:hypothetical protein
MKAMKQTTGSGEQPALCEVAPSELAEIAGGTIWVSDGYCMRPFPWPRPLLGQVVQQQVFIRE